MPNETITIIRIAATLAFLGVLLAGVHALKNYQKYFGVDPDVPSETSSGRSYSKMQMLCVWLHALALTGAFALLLD